MSQEKEVKIWIYELSDYLHRCLFRVSKEFISSKFRLELSSEDGEKVEDSTSNRTRCTGVTSAYV